MQLLQNKKVHKRNIFPDSKSVEFIISCHTHTHTHSGVMNNLIMIYIMTKKRGQKYSNANDKKTPAIILKGRSGTFHMIDESLSFLLYSQVCLIFLDSRSIVFRVEAVKICLVCHLIVKKQGHIK